MLLGLTGSPESLLDLFLHGGSFLRLTSCSFISFFLKGRPYCQYLSSLIVPCSTQEGWQLYNKAFINWKSQINGRKILCGRVSVMRRICSSPKESVSILYLGTCTFFDHKWESINKAQHGQDISVLIKHGILVVFKVLFTPCPKPAAKGVSCTLPALLPWLSTLAVWMPFPHCPPACLLLLGLGVFWVHLVPFCSQLLAVVLFSNTTSLPHSSVK